MRAVAARLRLGLFAQGCVGKENSGEKRSGCLMSGPLKAEWDSPTSCVLRGCSQGKESEGIRTK